MHFLRKFVNFFFRFSKALRAINKKLFKNNWVLISGRRRPADRKKHYHRRIACDWAQIDSVRREIMQFFCCTSALCFFLCCSTDNNVVYMAEQLDSPNRCLSDDESAWWAEPLFFSSPQFFLFISLHYDVFAHKPIHHSHAKIIKLNRIFSPLFGALLLCMCMAHTVWKLEDARHELVVIEILDNCSSFKILFHLICREWREKRKRVGAILLVLCNLCRILTSLSFGLVVDGMARFCSCNRSSIIAHSSSLLCEHKASCREWKESR